MVEAAADSQKKSSSDKSTVADVPQPEHPSSLKQDQAKNPNRTNHRTDQTAQLVEKRVIPELSIEGAQPVTEQSRENPQQQYVRNLYQTRIANSLARYSQADLSAGNAGEASGDLQKQKQEILCEQKRGVFGIASQDAFKKYLDWIQRQYVPGILARLNDLQLPTPPGAPIDANLTGGKDLRVLAATGNLPNDFLFIDPKKVPTFKDAQNIESVFDWIKSANATIIDTRNSQKDTQIAADIHQQNLPTAWLYKEGSDKDSWRASASDMIDLAHTASREVDAMDRLNRASGKFPLELPPNTTITRDGEGKITKLHLDLPNDLRQSDPTNAGKIERLRKWLDESTPKIEQAVHELIRSEDNSNTTIRWGEAEVASVKDDKGNRLSAQGMFDKDGHFLKVVDPRKIKDADVPAGCSLRNINAIDQRFQVQTLVSGDIQVTQTVQAESVPWYGYQNLGAAEIGQPMQLDRRTYKPTDFVTVSNGSGPELIQAKDLQQWKNDKQFMYYGGKTVNVVLDIAMVASGTVEVGAAIKAGRLLAAGIETVGALTARQALITGGEGALRATMGAAGLFNNFGARNTDIGATIDDIRGKYFLLDSAMGLTQMTRSLLGGAKLKQDLSRADKLKSLIENTAWMDAIDRTATPAFKATEYPIAAEIGTGLKRQIHDLMFPQDAGLTASAVVAFGDGKGLQKARANDFDNTKPESVASARRLLEDYKDLLAGGGHGLESARVTDILDKTSKLLAPDTSKQERQQFQQEMAKSLLFTSADIKRLEAVNPDKENRLSPEQLQQLANAEQRPSFPDGKLSDEATKIMREKDKSVRVAAEIALLFLSRDKGGKLPEKVETVKVTLPAVEKLQDQMVVAFVGSGGMEKVPTMLAPKDSDLAITTQMLTSDLRGMLENETNRARGIVGGDLLLRVGALTHAEYGAELQRVLLNRNSSKLEKMAALIDDAGARMSSIIAGLEQEETARNKSGVGTEAEHSLERSFGVSSNDLRKTLENVAAGDADSDVRAMAAAITFGLDLQKHSSRAGFAALNTFDQLWKQSKGEPAGILGTTITDALKRAVYGNDGSAQAAAAARAALTLSKDLPELKQTCRELLASYSDGRRGEILHNLHSISSVELLALQSSNPPLAAKLRDQALSLLKQPGSYADEDSLVKELPFLADLIRKGDDAQKFELKQRMQEFAATTDATAGFDRLRTAAINQLVNAGDESSFPVLRNAASNASPMVREAAVRALAQLKDSQLPQTIPGLIEGESDTANLARLKDLSSALQVQTPGTPESSATEKKENSLIAQLEAAETLLQKGHLKSFGGQNERQWIDYHFPLLNQNSFAIDAADTAAASHPFHWDTFLAAGDEINHEALVDLKRERKESEDRKAIQGVQAEREQQFNELCALAKGDARDADTDKAKKVLQDILESGGSILNRSNKLTIHKTDYQIRESDQYWRCKAASALADLATLGNSGRDLVTRYVARDLANEEVGGPAKLQLLDAWTKLTSPQQAGLPDFTADRVPISRRLAQQVVNTAITAEANKKSKEQNEQFQLAILNQSYLNTDTNTRESLKSLMDKTQFTNVRALASKLLKMPNTRTGT